MGSERPTLGSGRSNLGSGWPDLGSERTDLGSEKTDMRSKRVDLGLKGLHFEASGGEQTENKKFVLSGIIGRRPLRVRCPKGFHKQEIECLTKNQAINLSSNMKNTRKATERNIRLGTYQLQNEIFRIM